MESIVRSVNICETSTAKMLKKLKAKGFAPEAAEEAVAKAVKSSLIDDMRYANCLVRSAISTRRGFAKVERELKDLDIDIHDVRAFIEAEESGEADQFEMALEVLRLHPPKAKNLYASAYRKLINKGYSGEIAAEASRAWCEENSNNIYRSFS